MLRIHSLGHIEVTGSEGSLPWAHTQRRRTALLLFLAVERDVSRDLVCSVFWPDSAPDQARRALNQAVYDLRRLIGDARVIVSGSRIRLEDVWVDAVAFQDACQRGAADEALALYGGPFLAGTHLVESSEFEGWAERHASAFQRQHRTLRRQQIAACIERGELPAALESARTWVALEPGEDEAQHRVIELLAATGERTEALQHYDSYVRVLGEQGLAPLDETQALVASIRAGEGGSVNGPVVALRAQAMAHAAVSAAPGPKPAERRETEHIPPGGTLGPRRSRVILIAGLIVMSASVIGWFVVDRWWSGPDDVDSRSLAVFPFAGNGGQSDYLRPLLADLLSRNLAASDLQPVDAGVMFRLTVFEPDLSPVRARWLARRAGADKYVIGSFRQVASRIRIDAALHSYADGTQPLAAKHVEGDTTELFRLVAELAAGLLTGLTTGTASERLVGTAALTTSSLDAFKLYVIGEQHFRNGQHEAAGDAFQQALERDSTFALARYRLAFAHHMRGEHEAAHREIERTIPLAQRLSSHDRRVLAAFHAYHSGEIADAERQLRAIMSEYPLDLESKIVLAEILLQYAAVRGEALEEARLYLEEVIAADARFACIYCQLFEIADAQRDLEACTHWQQRIAATQRDDSLARGPKTRWIIAAAHADEAALRIVLPEFETMPDADYGRNVLGTAATYALAHGALDVADEIVRASQHRSGVEGQRRKLAFTLAMSSGRWRAADDEVVRWAEASRPAPDEYALRLTVEAPFEARSAALVDARQRLLGWRGRITAETRNVDWPEQLQPASRLYLLGLVTSRLGESAAARDYADSLDAAAGAEIGARRRLIAGLAGTVRADIALRAGEPKAALRELDDVATDIPPALLWPAVAAPLHANLLRARAHLAAGDHQQALRWLQAAQYAFDAGQAARYGTVARDMAKALDMAGRHDEAASHYARFVDAWRNADAALQPQVQLARVRLAALTARHPAR